MSAQEEPCTWLSDNTKRASSPHLFMQADKEAREDRANRDPDYDSHLGIERDPVTREITHVAAST